MSERQPGWIRVGFRRVGAGQTTGSGADANAYYVVTRATNAPVNSTNLGAQGSGLLQQTVSGAAASVSALTIAANRIPFGKADGSGVLDVSATFVRTASATGGHYVALGIATPFSSFGLASLGNGIDLYSSNAGDYSMINIGGYGGGRLQFTHGLRGSTQWFPGYINDGDDGLGGHVGHIAIVANRAGDTTGSFFETCGDFYAGTTSHSGCASFPGGVAIGYGFHGAANGLYDPAGGVALVLANDDTASVAGTGAGTPRNAKVRYYTAGGTVKKLQVSYEGDAYIDIATGGTGVTQGTGITIAANVVSANISTGVAGGQSAVGGTAASESLTLSSTANATKGRILVGNFFAIDEVNGRVLIGTQTAAAGAPLTIAATNASGFSIWAQAGVARFDTVLGVNVTPGSTNYVHFNPTATRDAILIGLGGVAIADSSARQYLDISPSNTVVTPTTAGTNWLTARFRQQTYTLASGSASLDKAVTVWIDGPPIFTGAGSFGTGYVNEALHVDSGISTFVGIVKIQTAGGVSALFADGPNQIVGVFGTSSAQRSNTAGNVTAGAAYTATERAMLTDCYGALRAYGWLT